MRERRAARESRRAREFEAFVAGAGGRLLHAATLLTGEPERDTAAAQRLLTAALARTYARWDRLRGEDPYDRTRMELAALFARRGHHYRHPRGGALDRLAPRERLVLVLRLYEGVAEEQTAAALGLPVERVRAICTRAVSMMRSGVPRQPSPPRRGGPARSTPTPTSTPPPPATPTGTPAAAPEAPGAPAGAPKTAGPPADAPKTAGAGS
ncbi:RNA polymerase [Streptomyces sp. NA02950]|uniref:sigma factor-like helix-turn-helix DNA-binding protein n=1 Tax=Streptomyces sp. NA02950 TaxID=2742137 RepID=UPI001590ACC1|nr:sigma factor-like helix-turn-helix DNA-binding protein [Streptomyces sp. NA02950]QKV97609.1 RNA polymerase [Streptomyces sp. NA02950]